MTTSGFHHADIKNKYFTRNVCSLIHVHTRVFVNLDSVSIKTSIVKSREITNSWDGTVHNIVRSFWYLIGIPAEMLPRHLSNIKAIWSLSYTISRIGNFARSYSYPPSTEAGDWTDTDRKADLHLNSGHGPACCLSIHAPMYSAHPPMSVRRASSQSEEFRPGKIVRWQKFNWFEIRHRTFTPMKFPASSGLPTDCTEHLPSCCRLFRLPTEHESATLRSYRYSAGEPPTIVLNKWCRFHCTVPVVFDFYKV